MISLNQDGTDNTKRLYFLAQMARYWILTLALLSVVFYMVFGAVEFSIWQNAQFTMKLEMLFCVAFFLLNAGGGQLSRKGIASFGKCLLRNRLNTILLIIWLLSVSISFALSPAVEMMNMLGLWRFLETLTHLVFFFCLYGVFRKKQINLRFLFGGIAASSLTLIVYFFWFFLLRDNSEFGDVDLLLHKCLPLFCNIRHAGYQVTAAIMFYCAFLSLGEGRWPANPKQNFLNIFILTWLIAYLCFLGGRMSMISVLLGFSLLILTLHHKKMPLKSIIGVMIISIGGGILLCELLSYYPWNGLFGSIQRTVETDSINELSSNRLAVWKATFNPILENLWFGLGPQGYYFMPGRVFGVQPHNVILQFLVEWGVIGSVSFIWLLLRLFIRGLRFNLQPKAVNPYTLSAGACICTLTLNALTDGLYYHTQPSVYLAIAFALWATPPDETENFET